MKQSSYIQWIRKQPCIVGLDCVGRIHAHHLLTRGAHGSNDSVISLCAKHHYEYHTLGKLTFAKKYNLDYDYLLKVFKRIYESENS